MRTAESWVSVISPAAHLGVAGELERQIKRIQLDALLSAAEIVNARISLIETWENVHIEGIRALRPVYDAILARAKEVEAQPHSTDEKKINPL